MSPHRAVIRRLWPLLAGGMLVAMSPLIAADGRAALTGPADFTLRDLEGEWHILAHIPYFLERNRVAPTIRFEPRGDGKYFEYFTARKGGFDAPAKTFKQVTWVPDARRPHRLRTRLFHLIPAHYSVLWIDRAAGLALLGTEDRDKAWIFSRSRTLEGAAYTAALKRFSLQGFDATRILRIPQTPEDLGKPGYARITR